MLDNISMAQTIVMAILKNRIGNRTPTEEEVKTALDESCKINQLSEEEYIFVKNDIHAKMSIQLDIGVALYDENTYNPWLSGRKAGINPYYWERYRRYLEEDKHWNSEVVKSLSEVGDEILNLLGDPKSQGEWIRKGLILGDIQSGKTSNYITLCNKAADAEYKVIILLTGTLESLRRQTQERIDTGFVGLSSRDILNRNQRTLPVGVGEKDRRRNAWPFTSIIKDFNADLLQALRFNLRGLPEPVILVVKKNKKVLENLERWLKLYNADDKDKIDLPMLLIDDEADNASVNTRGENNPTAINACIRRLICLFKRATYVAVTATPFANIFINPDKPEDVNEVDLFPSDFIYSLSAPTNYIGSNAIFGENSKYENCICEINDEEIEMCIPIKHRSSDSINSIPLSLKKAVGYFILSNVIRDITKNEKTHRSMLVNVSRFTNIQEQVWDLIKAWVEEVKSNIRNYSKLPLKQAMKNGNINFLFQIWEEFNLENITKISWKKIQSKLYESIMPIETRLVNQKTGSTSLDYEVYKEQGLRVIAVGGNSLSRGLTLEGLCVSYFYRNSQMYDTLMQMGRWFGYRDGYEEIFKIWMTNSSKQSYEYITRVSNELRDEIQEMRRQGLTPNDFGLRVEQDPDILNVKLIATARNKMKNTEIYEDWVSFSAKLIETPRLVAREENLTANIKATNDIIKNIFRYKVEDKGRQILFKNIPQNLIAEYIRSFSSHRKHLQFRAKEIGDYIERSSNTLWDVAIPFGSGQTITEDNNSCFSSEIKSLKIQTALRNMTLNENCLSISGNRARVGAPGGTKAGLEDCVWKKIKKQYEEQHIEDESPTIPDKEYLKVRRNPILLIHFLNINNSEELQSKNSSYKKAADFVKDTPIIALGIGFPQIDGKDESEKVKYVINMVEIRNIFGMQDDEEDDDDYFDED